MDLCTSGYTFGKKEGERMAYYPLFFDLSEKDILIIGGGHTAYEKAHRLQPFGPKLSVIALQICTDLQAMEGVFFKKQAWQETDLQDRFLVIAATNEPFENEKIAGLCRKQKILCSVVDNASLSQTIFGSVVHDGDLTIGISTSGASPSAARWLKKKITALVPSNFAATLSWLKARRPEIIERVEAGKRPKLFHKLFDACLQKGRPLSAQEYAGVLENCVKPTGKPAEKKEKNPV